MRYAGLEVVRLTGVIGTVTADSASLLGTCWRVTPARFDIECTVTSTAVLPYLGTSTRIVLLLAFNTSRRLIVLVRLQYPVLGVF